MPPRTNTAFWQAKIAGNRSRDADTDLRLQAAGWKVIRVWEHEDPYEAALKIFVAVKGQSDPFPVAGQSQ